jgi:general secretion pathway protein H
MAADRGFTLLELLVVIAVIGLLAAAGAQTMIRSSADLERQANRVEQRLYLARKQARESGLPVAIECVRPGREQGRLAMEEISRGEMSAARSYRGGHPVDRVTFYPDGSASGATIEIRVGEKRARLSVDWLSGEIISDDPSPSI